MDTGLMWFDNDPKTNIASKIEQAIAVYKKKFGITPDLCLINPKMFGESLTSVNGVTVKQYQQILPWHFWLGMTDSI